MTPKQERQQREVAKQPDSIPAILDPDWDAIEQAEFVAWRFPDRTDER